jgi:hypothetical protein
LKIKRLNYQDSFTGTLKWTNDKQAKTGLCNMISDKREKEISIAPAQFLTA